NDFSHESLYFLSRCRRPPVHPRIQFFGNRSHNDVILLIKFTSVNALKHLSRRTARSSSSRNSSPNPLTWSLYHPTPAPKIALTRFGAGVHSFWKAEKDLPVGIAPAVLRTWNDAVVGGYFV